jgi:hypothetical protein
MLTRVSRYVPESGKLNRFPSFRRNLRGVTMEGASDSILTLYGNRVHGWFELSSLPPPVQSFEFLESFWN